MSPLSEPRDKSPTFKQGTTFYQSVQRASLSEISLRLALDTSRRFMALSINLNSFPPTDTHSTPMPLCDLILRTTASTFISPSGMAKINLSGVPISSISGDSIKAPDTLKSNTREVLRRFSNFHDTHIPLGVGTRRSFLRSGLDVDFIYRSVYFRQACLSDLRLLQNVSERNFCFTSSTLQFFARPSSDSLDAIGAYISQSNKSSRLAAIPYLLTSSFTTLPARRWLKSRLYSALP